MPEYGSPPGSHQLLFELRDPSGRPTGWPTRDAHPRLVQLRDAALRRLSALVPGQPSVVTGVLIGRRPGAPRIVPKHQRTRIVCIPSPSEEAPVIRHVLVEVPGVCPISVEPLIEAFTGLEVASAILVPTSETQMLQPYTRPTKHWQTVTPMVLPRGFTSEHATDARAAIQQALRHAEVRASCISAAVRPHPWEPGARPAPFDSGRFEPMRLQHVKLELDRPISGPLLLGDGRFLGLGLFRSQLTRTSVHAFTISEGLVAEAEPERLARHLRRAVMSRCQREWAQLPEWVTGHAPDGSPARGHAHLRFAFDPVTPRLLVIRPHRDQDARLQRALDGLHYLHAGRAGSLRLQSVPIAADDRLLRHSAHWSSVTEYAVDRHRRAKSARAAIVQDVRHAMRSAHLPEATSIRVTHYRSTSGGLRASMELVLEHAVAGPLMLGRTSHLGGGLFEATC